MLRIIVTGLLLAVAVGISSANDSAVSEFERQARSLGESISTDDSGRSVRCQELGRQMEQLKGRPQQRYTIRQEYLRECQGDPVLSPEPVTPRSDF